MKAEALKSYVRSHTVQLLKRLAPYIPNSATAPSTVQTKPSYASSGMAKEENALKRLVSVIRRVTQ